MADLIKSIKVGDTIYDIGEQPDWQASLGEPGHILNRTHYEDIAITETVCENISVYGDRYTFFSTNSLRLDYCYEKNIICYIDGEKGYFNNKILVSTNKGNSSIKGPYTSYTYTLNTGELVLHTKILNFDSGAVEYETYGDGDSSKTYNVSIYLYTSSVIQLDEKYIPSTIARVSDTTYSAGPGISLSGTTFSNSGVRSISTGTTNGTITVNVNGTLKDVTIKGLGSNAYTSTPYLPLNGGTLTGDITIQKSSDIATNSPATLNFKTIQTDNNVTTTGAFIKVYDDHDTSGYGTNMIIQSAGNVIIGSGESPNACYSTDLSNSSSENMYITSDGSIYFYTNCQTYANKKTGVYINTSGALYGAVWNDYAEYRQTVNEVKPGQVVVENGDGTLRLSTERLQPGCEIVSDTFGFAIGETDECKTPIAAAGRVLAYTYEDRNSYLPGDAVCSAPNGKVSRMTREEIINYPERIIGTVSEIPTYENWGTGNIKVDGRIWIRIR